MEGTHGKLSARFADGLSSDNADCLACVDGLADGKVDAVALCADAGASFAGQNAADLDGLYAVCFEDFRILGHKHMVGIKQDLAGCGIANGNCREAAVDAGAEGLDDLSLVDDLAHPYALGGAAVGLTDDDILADIDHTAGKVTGVCGTKCGIGKTLSCTSGGDEVLQNGKAFTEVCLDWYLDGLTGGVSHKATHTGKLTDLVHRTTSAGVRHHVDRIVGVKAVLKCSGDILGGLFPLGDNEAVTLVIGNEAALELTLDLDDLLLSLAYEGLLRLRHGHVGDGDCDSALGGVLVAHCLDAVENFGRNGEAVLLDAAVNDIAQLLLADLEADLVIEHGLGIGAVNISQILRNVLIEDYAADGALDNLGLLNAVDGLGNSY